ncbi:hypothetical protein IAR50_004199 [Cryptococcus sp. DSM 104548]
MILRWYTNESAERYQKRGGAGYGITTTASSVTSYGAGPPSSTYSRWHGTGSQPEIAGSTGGFIGLISGIAILVIIATLAGLYLRNRYKKRLPKQTLYPSLPSSSGRGKTKPTLPALSISRPSTDPYALGPSASQLNDTPIATSGNSFARPLYSRQKSSEWDLPLDSAVSSASGGGTPRKEGYGELGVEMPEEPGEAAWPLRSVHRRPSFSPHKGSFSSTVSGEGTNLGSGDEGAAGKGKGRLYDPLPLSVASPGPGAGAGAGTGMGGLHNPFDSPFDEASPAYAKPLGNDAVLGLGGGGKSPLLRPESAVSGEYGEALELDERTPRVGVGEKESGRLGPSSMRG